MAFLGFARLALPGRGRPCSRRFSTGSKWFRGVFLILLGMSWLGSSDSRAESDSREYQIKAAFLFNFVQFVKWPGASFASDDAPFYIGILGDDPFNGALEETIRGESIGGHPLKVVHGQSIDDLKNCQMIFISRSEQSRLSAILSQLDSRPILTVSEVQSFTRSGGAIDFYLSGGKVRFEINPQSAERCGLKISSQLLALGRIVEP